jgi:bifunctional N-acetylglucosamine-1-phosphate-uridyltransferase/glucosamine-1-phosphate-acetyltransferase GlmU-like protein
LSLIIQEKIQNLDNQYIIENGIAIHQTAVIESNVILKAPIIISENCFIGANAYLRGGVFLGKSAKIGTACEIKTSLIFSESAIAHFNFIGDSLIGSQVNFEAGSITANHFNERTDKQIVIHYQGQKIPTQSEKFGALVGDYSKIGANAVLSPGTILEPYSIVKRLELVEQNK